jgi:Mg-chelatase subunit ChlD
MLGFCAFAVSSSGGVFLLLYCDYMWASRRRTIILLIIIGFFLLFVVLPYWITHKKVPTCSDSKMNQNELGVDCGGACALVCPRGAKPLSIFWTKVFLVRSGVYDIVSSAENANFAIAAPSIPYVVKLYDKDGVVIAEKTGETYAKPNERFFIFDGNILTGTKIAVKGSIEFPKSFNWYTQVASLKEEKFAIENKLLTGVNRKPRLTAVLKNDTPSLYRDIDITAVVYDTQNQPIAVSSTKVAKIEKYGSERLSFTWSQPFEYTSESEACEVPIDAILLLDRSGSMSSESKEPPQPFMRVREATAAFVGFTAASDQVGMVSYSTTASNPIDLPLIPDKERARERILATKMGTDGIQYTNTGDALLRAGEEFETQRSREDAKKVIVLLTDGEALEPNRPLRDGEPDFAKTYAKNVAQKLKDSGVTLYTIGLGINANAEFLTAIASTPAQYYPSPSASDLRDVYKQIASTLCKKPPTVIEIIPRVQYVQ